MRAVIQRVSRAAVTIMPPPHPSQSEGDQNNPKAIMPKAEIGQGFLVLVGCCNDDTQQDIDWLCRKITGLRVFDDEQGVMNRSIMDTGGDILVVSQFTLWASYKKGNRPSYLRAGSHDITKPLYEQFVKRLSESLGKPIGTGEFGAMMQVELINDGPVTICMDSKNPE